MRVSLLFALSYLSTAVYAGGYQGCLERIWMYQAYQIDALNDEDSQTIGFKCKSWNKDEGRCDGEWKPCGNPPKRCDFNEWSIFLGRGPTHKGWAEFQKDSSTRLNIEETAKICYKRFYTEATGKKKGVPNPPPYAVMKGTTGGPGQYNDQIKKVSMMTTNLYTQRTSENQHLWDDLDDAIKKIVIAREGDHGSPHAIDHAREYFKDVLDIKTEDLGVNPGSGEKWEKVDWKKTWDEARSKGVDDVSKRFREYFDDFYGRDRNNPAPRNHLSVIRSFKRAQDRNVRCRS